MLDMDDVDDDILNMRDTYYNTRRKDTFIRYWSKANIISQSGSLSECYDNGFMDEIYNVNKSITQSLRATTGKDFEKCIETILDKYNVPFSRQVKVNKDTHIIQKRSGNTHALDIVIPPVKYGDDIDNYIVLSCKTSLRERYLQDSTYRKCYIITCDTKTNSSKNIIYIRRNGSQFKEFLVKIVENGL